jgi:rhodanese-related sulfurtransferase
VDYAALLKQGALILDVRSPAEYKQGHIKGSINAPLNELSKHISKLKETAVILLCIRNAKCISKGVLKSNGFTQVYNGGGWVAYKTKKKYNLGGV